MANITEFKGTKGPWRVVDDYADYHPYSPENPQIYIWDGDEQASKPICDMGEMGDLNYSEELANANLIAAAPEMLENLINSTELLVYFLSAIGDPANTLSRVGMTRSAHKHALILTEINKAIINKALSHE